MNLWAKPTKTGNSHEYVKRREAVGRLIQQYWLKKFYAIIHD